MVCKESNASAKGANLALLLATAVWGLSFPLTKNALAFMDAYSYIGIRFTVAAALLYVLFFRKFRKPDRRLITHGTILGVMLFAGMALQTEGLRFTTASNSAFLTGFCVILVPVFLLFIFRRKPPLHAWVGVGLGMAGLLLISGIAALRVNPGDLLTLGSAVVFALHIILVDLYARERDPLPLVTVQLGVCGLLGVAGWLVSGRPAVAFNGSVVAALAVTTVFCTAVNYTIQMAFQRKTTPVNAALIYNLEPVFGLLFALVVPNVQGAVETVDGVKLAGCAVMLAGMLWPQLAEMIKRKRTAGAGPAVLQAAEPEQ